MMSRNDEDDDEESRGVLSKSKRKQVRRVLANNRCVKDVIAQVNRQSEEIQLEIDEVRRVHERMKVCSWKRSRRRCPSCSHG